MGGVLDFLFEGQAPASVTTYGSTVESMPKWYSDYTQGLINKANIVAAEPYQPYTGARVANFTGDQNQAFTMARSNIGSYMPNFAQANNYTTQAGDTSIMGAAQPYMDKAAGTTYGNISSYMNPYVSNVIDRAGTLAQRQINEKLMPALEGAFTRNGQYGSVAHQREADRAVRDLGEGLQGQAQAALADAYQTAGTQYQADANRWAGLAGTAGNLANMQGNLQLGAGSQQAKLAELLQNLGIKDAASLQSIGAQQQAMSQKNLDLAYQDFLDQRDYERGNVDWLSTVIRGMQPGSTKTTTETGPLAGSQYGPSLLDNIGSLVSIWKGITSDDGE
jgi:hypothetical protein